MSDTDDLAGFLLATGDRLMPRTPEELTRALEEQVAALRSSSAAFDAGELWESKRLATAVYTLVHDGRGRTTSLLTQTGIRDQMLFMASAPPMNPANLLSDMPLVMTYLAGSDTTRYVAIFGDCPFPPQWLPFADWWGQPVLKDQRSLSLSRKELVLTLRDQEGGSHFDQELTNPAYISVVQGNVGWLLTTPEGTRAIDPGPQFATMRQIAWELQQSLSAAKLI